MTTPASGSRALFAWRRELRPGVPDLTTGMIAHKVVLPATWGFKRPEGASGQVNPSGFKEPGLPGPVGTEQDVAFALTASSLLEPLENLLGGVSKEQLEDDIFRYAFVQDSYGAATSLEAVYALPPTDVRGRLYGLRIDSITKEIGNNTSIAARMKLKAQHGTRLDHATADAGNLGTYAAGPIVRGPMALEPRVPIHVQIERDVAGGGLRYLAEQAESPTFPGQPIAVPYDHEGRAVWQNLQVALRLSGTVTVAAGDVAVVGTDTRFLDELKPGLYLTVAGESRRIAAVSSDTTLTLAMPHTAGAVDSAAHLLNRDAGFWDEHRDLLEMLFPGTAAEHAVAAVGDTWTFAEPGGWPDPVPTFLAGQRYTSAHWRVLWRPLGASIWRDLDVQSGQVVLSWPTSLDQGNASKYPNALDRDGESSYTISLPRKLRDTAFIELAEAHRRFELQLRYEGRQLGTGQYRESLIETCPYVAVDPQMAISGGCGGHRDAEPGRREQPGDRSATVRGRGDHRPRLDASGVTTDHGDS